MINQTLFMLTLIVLLCYGALLSMRIEKVKHAYFIRLKRRPDDKIHVHLTSLTPAIYIRRWWLQTIKISAFTGLFIVEGVGKPINPNRKGDEFKYVMLTVGRWMVGLRTNPDSSHTPVAIKLNADFDPAAEYLRLYISKRIQGE